MVEIEDRIYEDEIKVGDQIFKDIFENGATEYHYYDFDKEELQTLWLNPDGNDGRGTIRIDYIPFSLIQQRFNKGQKFLYQNDFYEQTFDQVRHEFITDLEQLYDLLENKEVVEGVARIPLSTMIERIKNKMLESENANESEELEEDEMEM